MPFVSIPSDANQDVAQQPLERKSDNIERVLLLFATAYREGNHMTHSKVSRFARRAIPAFVVAGLGLTLQAAPALAVPETPTAMATEDQPTSTEQGAVTGVAADGSTKAHETLQAALRQGYSKILVNQNLTECLIITEDGPSDPTDPEPSRSMTPSY